MDETTVMRAVRALVDEYRQRCLWYLRDDFYPATRAEVTGPVGHAAARLA
jgi:hypothetical protein